MDVGGRGEPELHASLEPPPPSVLFRTLDLGDDAARLRGTGLHGISKRRVAAPDRAQRLGDPEARGCPAPVASEIAEAYSLERMTRDTLNVYAEALSR